MATTQTEVAVATGAADAALVAETVAAEGATVATTALGTAMKALPIVAIAAALAGLAYGVYEYASANSEAAEQEKKAAKQKELLKKRSEEQKKRISESQKGIATGRVPWNKGKTYSYAEDYVPWNKGKKLTPFSEEHKKKISDSRKGKVPSEETRRKISEAHKGRVPWNKGKSGYESKKWSKKVPNDKKEKSANRNSKSGIKGVCFNKLAGKWRAYIMHNTQNIHLGTFVNIEDAIAARIAGEKNYIKCNKVQKSVVTELP
jgi:hypothetical protein